MLAGVVVGEVGAAYVDVDLVLLVRIHVGSVFPAGEEGRRVCTRGVRAECSGYWIAPADPFSQLLLLGHELWFCLDWKCSAAAGPVLLSWKVLSGFLLRCRVSSLVLPSIALGCRRRNDR